MRKNKGIPLRMSERMMDFVKTEASSKEMTISGFIRQLIVDYEKNICKTRYQSDISKKSKTKVESK